VVTLPESVSQIALANRFVFFATKDGDLQARALPVGSTQRLTSDAGADLAGDDREVYFVDRGQHSIRRIKIDSHEEAVVVPPRVATISALKLDASHVYWMESSGPTCSLGCGVGQLWMVPRGGGKPRMLAPAGNFGNVGIASDATCVYWFEGQKLFMAAKTP
jgi:hypothetical protein